MFDATAQDRDADANSLDSLNSFAGESRLGVERKFWEAEHCSGRFSEIDIASEHPYRRRELLHEAFSKLSYRVARV